MTSRPKKYGAFSLCSMIVFTVTFTILFGGLSGAFSSPETGTNIAVLLGAIPTGLGLAFVITFLGLCYFVCQEET